jgi:hypothetical protein
MIADDAEAFAVPHEVAVEHTYAWLEQLGQPAPTA